jgi:predicted nucleic acid-binding protein
MLLTLDTNILYPALMSSTGASNFILQQVRSRRIQIALSVAVFLEYKDVLTREKSLKDFILQKSDVDKFLKIYCIHCKDIRNVLSVPS